MIYGNTGAGLVDVDVPQSPLYQQALPNLRDVSAAAWGLPSLDDISVPDITTEKDIQTDTDLTQKYFDLATKLKDYAVKGRSVGIDVTKPKNNPTHLQFSQEWNKMYQEFLQTGKELKNAKANIGSYGKSSISPNTYVAPLEKGQVVTDDYLNQRVIENPFQNSKQLVRSYQGLKPIYDNATYEQFKEKWLNDNDMIDAEAEAMKQQKPLLADRIDADAETLKASLFPPQMNYELRAKLAQDMQKHRENLGVKKYNAETSRGGLELRQSQQQVAEGQFSQGVNQLINTPDTQIQGMFGEFVFDADAGKDKFEPHTAITTSATNLKKYGVSSLKQPDGSLVDVSKLNPNDKFIVVDAGVDKDKKKIRKVYPVTDKGLASFTAKYQQPYKRLEEQAKQQVGSYDLTQDDGVFDVVGNQPDVKVSTKTTQTNSTKSTNSTIKKVSTAKTYSIINPQNGQVVASGVSKEVADKAIAKGYKVK